MAKEATTLAELEKMLNDELGKALDEAARDGFAKTKKKVGTPSSGSGFYTGHPKVYKRTGLLGSTPRRTEVTKGTNEGQFEIYLDTSSSYSTGKKPSMEVVLELATTGKNNFPNIGSMKETVGYSGFWSDARDEIEKSLNKAMKKHFDG